jgi:hypothetical protein
LSDFEKSINCILEKGDTILEAFEYEDIIIVEEANS